MGNDEEDGSVWKVYGSRTIYDNQWIKVDLVDLEQPDGHRFEHHVVRLRAAAIAVMLDEQDRVLMLWRHRFVADRWGYELPGGLVDDGEEPIETITREIEEETGYRATSIKPLLSFEPMVGMLDSPHHLFVARDLEQVGEPTDVTESARLQWIPLTSLPDLIAKGEIWNSGTLIAVMQILLSRHEG
ncbi:NUDIX domain-containing protein [Actinospica robiniae]|uniref:NUDIX domain-containing protein n=1 Tax=Actinospica robiniae TaxID=304901 RepID=UPI0004018A51|nr:NUDIX hydrolase [Actinospica robiniae]